MNRNEMIKRLQDGEEPIEVTLDKWIDISNSSSKNMLGTRHQLDEGIDNCALCYVFEKCVGCPVFDFYSVRCDESRRRKESRKYKKDFYARYVNTGNPQIIIDMLNKLKKKGLWVRSVLFARKMIKKIKRIWRWLKTPTNLIIVAVIVFIICIFVWWVCQFII